MTDLYLVFQFVNGCCHGNQIMLRNEGKLILCARSPDGSTVFFHDCLLGDDTVAPSGLYARLCHAFLITDILSQALIHPSHCERADRLTELRFSILLNTNRSFQGCSSQPISWLVLRKIKSQLGEKKQTIQ